MAGKTKPAPAKVKIEMGTPPTVRSMSDGTVEISRLPSGDVVRVLRRARTSIRKMIEPGNDLSKVVAISQLRQCAQEIDSLLLTILLGDD